MSFADRPYKGARYGRKYLDYCPNCGSEMLRWDNHLGAYRCRDCNSACDELGNPVFNKFNLPKVFEVAFDDEELDLPSNIIMPERKTKGSIWKWFGR